jgi:hypothetical protein
LFNRYKKFKLEFYKTAIKLEAAWKILIHL